jgi:hypothetical protein
MCSIHREPLARRLDRIFNDLTDFAMTNVNCEIMAPQSFKLSVLSVGRQSCSWLRPVRLRTTKVRLPAPDLSAGGTRRCWLGALRMWVVMVLLSRRIACKRRASARHGDAICGTDRTRHERAVRADGFPGFSWCAAPITKQRDTPPYILAAGNCLTEPREV